MIGTAQNWKPSSRCQSKVSGPHSIDEVYEVFVTGRLLKYPVISSAAALAHMVVRESL